MGKYDDIVNNIISRSTPGGAGGGPALSPELFKARQTALSAAMSSPEARASGKYNEIVDNIIARTQGQPKPSFGGGIMGTLGKGLMKGLEGLGYVVGLPARAVTSIGKETADLLRGEGFSAKELVTQPFQKDFYASKFIPKTNNKWVDTVIGLGADIVTDPLMWVGAGALKYAGRTGRTALAEKAVVLGKELNMPELVAKADDIIRSGQSLKSLTDAERKVLGIEKGLRWTFGQGGNKLIFDPESKAGAISGKIAGATERAVSAPLSSVRARLGDAKWMRPVQDFVRPASYAGTMNRLGRGELSVSEVVMELGKHSSAVRGNAERRLVENVLGQEHAELQKKLVASPYRETVHQVAEGVRPAADAAEQQLADELADFYSKTLGRINQYVDEFNTKRGANAWTISAREDYGVNHTMTDDARNFWFSGKWRRSPYKSELEQSLELTGSDVVYGPSITRARKLNKGDTWLGKKLETGSVAEINAQSEKVLGFKWFKEDAAALVDDYISSAADQVARITFMDRMLDFGPDVIKTIAREVVPDPKLLKSLDAVIESWTSVANSLGGHLADLQGEAVKSVLTPATARAQQRVSGRAARAADRAKKTNLEKLAEEVVTARAQADALAAAAAGARGKAASDLQDILRPLQVRLAALEDALGSANASEAVAIEALTSSYRRVFGVDAPVPDNPAEMLSALRGENVPAASGGRAATLARRRAGGEDVSRTLREATGQEQAIGRARVAREQATGEVTAQQKRIQRASDNFEKELRATNPEIRAAAEAEERAVAAVNAFDNAEALLVRDDLWETQVRPALQTQIDGVRTQGASRGRAGEINMSWADETDRVIRSIQDPQFFTAEERAAWDRIYTALKSAETELASAQRSLSVVRTQVGLAQNAVNNKLFGTMVVKQIDEGWKAIESLGVQMQPELYDSLFARVKELRTPKGIMTFNKMFRSYNQFFKVTAMLTPGFIVRNAYSAAFNNFVAGVGLKDTMDAIKFIKTVNRIGYEKAVAALPAGERAIYELAYRGVTSSGAGITRDLIVEPILGPAMERFMNTKVVSTWSDVNSSTESAVRMALSLNRARGGLDLDAIAADVARYHFDYTDLSKLDEIAKQFIPFWLWVTRNIPLQIVNKAARPGLYNAYESLRRQLPPDENMVLPGWLARRGPLGLSAGMVINPDLPFIDLEEQIKQVTDPLQLLSNLYPQYKLPIELAGNRRLGLNIPFSEKPQPVRGPLDFPAALIAALTGQGMDTAEGYATSEKVSYALGNLLPTLGTLQRLVPQAGGPERYSERQLSSVLGALGVPVREVTAGEQEREMSTRQFALKDYLDEMRRRGFL